MFPVFFLDVHDLIFFSVHSDLPQADNAKEWRRRFTKKSRFAIHLFYLWYDFQIAPGIRARFAKNAESSSSLNQRTTTIEHFIAERQRVQYVIECSRKKGNMKTYILFLAILCNVHVFVYEILFTNFFVFVILYYLKWQLFTGFLILLWKPDVYYYYRRIYGSGYLQFL